MLLFHRLHAGTAGYGLFQDSRQIHVCAVSRPPKRLQLFTHVSWVCNRFWVATRVLCIRRYSLLFKLKQGFFLYTLIRVSLIFFFPLNTCWVMLNYCCTETFSSIKNIQHLKRLAFWRPFKWKLTEKRCW